MPSTEENADLVYLDGVHLRYAGIRLKLKSYDDLSYPQLQGEFVKDVTVLDLLFNTGPEARKNLKSRTPDRLVVGSSAGTT